MENPLISIILATKNSLPHLKEAIDGIRDQTYKNFELIIQDGGSTDGTLEYLYSVKDLPRIDIASMPDSGIGQAYNRGIGRSNGDFVCFAGSDEILYSHSFEMALGWFRENPSAAAIYGGVELVDEQGGKSKYTPKPFDLFACMRCEVVPPIAGLFNRRIIGEDLFYDESLKTCPDFDFWLRLGSRFSSKQILHRSDVFMKARADRKSMTYRPECYEQFTRDKCFIVDRFIKRLGWDEGLKDRSQAGILLWAANSIAAIEGVTPAVLNFFEQSAKKDPKSQLLIDFISRWKISGRQLTIKFQLRYFLARLSSIVLRARRFLIFDR